jgi:hypothetical protein
MALEIIQNLLQPKPKKVVIQAIRIMDDLRKIALDQKIVLDATVTLKHSLQAEPTQHPVEGGSSITDHVHVKPDMLELEGVISDTPINPISFNVSDLATRGAVAATQKLGNAVGSFAGTGFGGLVGGTVAGLLGLGQNSSRSINGFNVLQEIMKKRHPVRVITGLKVYDQMIITSLDIPQDASIGRSLRITISLQEVQFVRSESFLLPETALLNSSGTKDVGLGQQVTGAIDDITKGVANSVKDVLGAGKNQSVAKGLVNKFSGAQ